MAVDWSELGGDPLGEISRKLPNYVDYVQFRSVCKSWQSAAPPIPEHGLLPWLVILPQSGSFDSHCTFFDSSTNGGGRSLRLPEAAQGTRRCGSSHGFLVLLDDYDDTPCVLLLNPLTGDGVSLPPLSNSGERYSIKKVVLSSSPQEPQGFTALAILEPTGGLAFFRKGDPSWTFFRIGTFSDSRHSYVEDAVFRKGSFYAVNKFGEVAVCDVRGVPPNVTLMNTPTPVDAEMQYLVNSGDDLLLVCRHLGVRSRYEEYFITEGFQVFKMDRIESRWETVDNLGDKMLFIGLNSSFSLSASDFPGCDCVGNSIYFTDDYTELSFESAPGEHDCGIFKLGARKPLWPWQANREEHWPPPLWVAPNPVRI